MIYFFSSGVFEHFQLMYSNI